MLVAKNKKKTKNKIVINQKERNEPHLNPIYKIKPLELKCVKLVIFHENIYEACPNHLTVIHALLNNT